jgi:hypothetical protein
MDGGRRKIEGPSKGAKRETDLLLLVANIDGDLGRAKLSKRGSVVVVLPVDGGLLTAGEGGGLGRICDLERGKAEGEGGGKGHTKTVARAVEVKRRTEKSMVDERARRNEWKWWMSMCTG